MGIEYKIYFKIPENYEIGMIRDHLINPKDENGRPAFILELTENGFYFCDNCWSKQAGNAFKNVINEALMYSDSVKIENL